MYAIEKNFFIETVHVNRILAIGNHFYFYVTKRQSRIFMKNTTCICVCYKYIDLIFSIHTLVERIFKKFLRYQQAISV